METPPPMKKNACALLTLKIRKCFFYLSLDFNKRKQQKRLINTLSTVVERI